MVMDNQTEDKRHWIDKTLYSLLNLTQLRTQDQKNSIWHHLVVKYFFLDFENMF